MMTTINISELVENLTPIDQGSLYHRICIYMPVNLMPLVTINLAYTLLLYLEVAQSVFGNFSGDSMRDKLLSAFFTPEKAIGKILIVNLSYFVVAWLFNVPMTL